MPLRRADSCCHSQPQFAATAVGFSVGSPLRRPTLLFNTLFPPLHSRLDAGHWCGIAAVRRRTPPLFRCAASARPSVARCCTVEGRTEPSPFPSLILRHNHGSNVDDSTAGRWKARFHQPWLLRLNRRCCCCSSPLWSHHFPDVAAVHQRVAQQQFVAPMAAVRQPVHSQVVAAGSCCSVGGRAAPKPIRTAPISSEQTPRSPETSRNNSE